MEENYDGVGLGDVDFNVDNEYKPDPLIPKSWYHGVVNSVKFFPEQFCIMWDVCLKDNGGAMNDGVTPVDGAHCFYKNWLPKPGDENEATKSGRSTKRQWKINALKAFQEKTGVDFSTPAKIMSALTEQTYVGLEVDVELDVEEYQGVFRNTVRNMKAN